jgi:hypothetical protein
LPLDFSLRPVTPAQVLPILRAGLASPDVLQRAGVCLGLSEVMLACSRPQILGYLDELVSTVLAALCDAGDGVRAAAAQAFDALHRQIGQRAVEEVVPALLSTLDDGGANSLQGLRQLLAARGRVVLPFLVPKLIAPPMTPANARALAALAEVSGEALCSRIPTVLGALLDGMCGVGFAGGADAAAEAAEAIGASAERVVLSVPQASSPRPSSLARLRGRIYGASSYKARCPSLLVPCPPVQGKFSCPSPLVPSRLYKSSSGSRPARPVDRGPARRTEHD